MAAKNSIKEYVAGGYYHLYNRGVEKRIIFQDEQDYKVFLSYLKEYLGFRDENGLREQLGSEKVGYKEKDKIIKLLNINNYFERLSLLAFCLMPNHFHFLVKQKDADLIDSFMNSLCTRYSMYFNHKYRRVGKLFQGVYKAVLVDNDEYLMHLSRYIHAQAKKTPSSYDVYLGKQHLDWVYPEEILAYFSKTNKNLTYKTFVEGSKENSFDQISRLLID